MPAVRMDVEVPQAEIDAAVQRELGKLRRKVQALETKLRAAERREQNNKALVDAAKELQAVLGSSILVDHYWED